MDAGIFNVVLDVSHLYTYPTFAVNALDVHAVMSGKALAECIG
jgi:mannose-6-phosphate isomerase class I